MNKEEKALKARELLTKPSFNSDVMEHFKLIEEFEESARNDEAVNWKIAKSDDAKELTKDMLGFGTGQKMRVIIDYDPEYEYFIVRQIKKVETRATNKLT